MKFKEIIKQLEDEMAGSDSPLQGFEYSKTHTEYVWIRDSKKIIGTQQAHYEILSENGNVSVNLDFEGNISGDRAYKFFQRNLGTLPTDIQWRNRRIIKRLTCIPLLNQNDPNIVSKISAALQYMDNSIGDTIRKLLKPNNNNKKITKKEYPTMTNMPLNQILYGPPGTGKTYKLVSEYFPLFTTEVEEISDEQYHIDVIKKYTWWQAVAAALLELGTVEVTKILQHPIVIAKNFISNQKSPRAMVWSMLQRHTKLSNKLVEYKLRDAPYLFDKDSDGKWTVDINVISSEAPEINELLDEWKNKPSHNGNTVKRYEFITFHQSFSYEDFVEGIKPIMPEGEDEVKELLYNVESGIFKRICLRASLDPEHEYALFIDEINRGNVSQILGELITLIEEDKRAGNENEMSVVLPYSKTEFSVPNNLYIIGTMNTADRSIEALDTALRRRFSFVEMTPKPELLSPACMFRDFLWKCEEDGWDDEPYKSNEKTLLEMLGASPKIWDERKNVWNKMYKLKEKREEQLDYFKTEEFTGINLEQLLLIINKRVEKLLSKDHMIGHAYFIGVYSLQGLKEVFQDKIVPLMQEYFYGDYGKIGLVLGGGFIKVEEQDENIFAEMIGYNAEGLDQRLVYKILPAKEMDNDKFMAALLLLQPATK